MAEITLQEFDKLKQMLALKYAQYKTLDKEIAFLKKRYMDLLTFRDENEWKSKTDHATLTMKEGYKLSYPGNSDIDKKREFYQFMQAKDKGWYQQSVSLNWNAVNAYANTEIDALATQGKEWEPWPHCERSEEKKFDMRVRPGVMTNLFDPRVVSMIQG